MTTEQFTYWLQGYFELSGATSLNEQQVKIIKDHIALVINKQTPVGITITGGSLYNYDRDGIRIMDTSPATNIIDVPTNLTC
jgi:hypothetical protein